ncbi:MAG: phosphatase PAP2 family protein [Tenacibaculum sp.]
MNTAYISKISNAIRSLLVLNKLKLVFVNLAFAVKKPICIVYGIFFTSSLLLVSVFNKFSLHLYINQFHTSFFDFFFKYATYLGDGLIFAFLGLIFLFVKRKMALVFLVSGLLTLLFTHFFKKLIFRGIPRPVGALGEEVLHLVSGVKMAMWNTFPSGHTTTAFAVFSILCLYFAKDKLQYIWVFLALIAGFSRIYLSQHFLIDVLFGSLLGIFIGFISTALFYKVKRVH